MDLAAIIWTGDLGDEVLVDVTVTDKAEVSDIHRVGGGSR